MKPEKNEYWRKDLKDAGIEFKEEDVVHEMINGKEHTIIFGKTDQKGFLKMLIAEAGADMVKKIKDKFGPIGDKELIERLSKIVPHQEI
jgi:hypothetical protein